jgi:hypothetical protein
VGMVCGWKVVTQGGDRPALHRRGASHLTRPPCIRLSYSIRMMIEAARGSKCKALAFSCAKSSHAPVKVSRLHGRLLVSNRAKPCGQAA